MRLSRDVRSVAELAAEGVQIVRDVAEQRRTVLLTEEGSAKAVLMDVASYDRWRDTVALLRIIAQGEADADLDRTVPQGEAFARAERAIAEVEAAG